MINSEYNELRPLLRGLRRAEGFALSVAVAQPEEAAREVAPDLSDWNNGHYVFGA